MCLQAEREALASGEHGCLIQNGPCPAPQLWSVICYGCIKTEEYVTPSGEETGKQKKGKREPAMVLRHTSHAALSKGRLNVRGCHKWEVTCDHHVKYRTR